MSSNHVSNVVLPYGLVVKSRYRLRGEDDSAGFCPRCTYNCACLASGVRPWRSESCSPSEAPVRLSPAWDRLGDAASRLAPCPIRILSRATSAASVATSRRVAACDSSSTSLTLSISHEATVAVTTPKRDPTDQSSPRSHRVRLRRGDRAAGARALECERHPEGLLPPLADRGGQDPQGRGVGDERSALHWCGHCAQASPTGPLSCETWAMES